MVELNDEQRLRLFAALCPPLYPFGSGRLVLIEESAMLCS
jgi:hypothetical protein